MALSTRERTTMKPMHVLAIASMFASGLALAQPTSPGARDVPAKVLPVPDTVSPQMQAVIGQPYGPNWNVVPKSPAEWKAIVDNAAAQVSSGLPEIRQQLDVNVQPTSIDGVKAFIVTPSTIPPPNRDRVL